MKKAVLLLMLGTLYVSNIQAQEVCESSEDAVADLNSITKCTVKQSDDDKNKKTRQITVKVSASKRYLKKRELAKKQSVNSLASVNSSGIESNEVKSEFGESLSFKNNIEDIKNKLSAEEIKSALKFSTVDKIPAFEECSSVKDDERMNCFNEAMIKHIQKYFRYPSQAVKESIQGEVWVRFIIDKDGNVKNIKALGPKNGDILNNEAKRVVYNLPKFKPAKKDGKRVSVKYGFPITFSLDE
ncbi:energy transducer TonB [Tenacibaculum sp. TC6]|uniref:energy transducer TonB n=1 Tax=Tenacibaculum sp. TC6 TaxID=3423223 RepID=UPI003D36FFDA